jgi:hypothetical protein
MDVTSDFNILGGLPKGSARQALDAEIANEGGKVLAGDKVLLSNGEQVAWTPPPEKLVMPDLSNVKSLRHYFGQRGFQVYPAWLYHPTKPAVIVQNAKEAAEHGIVYRQATVDERNRYGLKDVWDWEEDSKWRPTPWSVPKFDPKNPGSGKTVIYSAPDPRIAQNDLVAQLIPAVAAAVAQSLKTTGPAAPASVDPAQWEAFLAFQAFQKAQEVVTAVASEPHQEGQGGSDQTLFSEGGNALSPEQDRFLWEEEAKRLGIKVDGRWSNERLKAEVQKASPGAA